MARSPHAERNDSPNNADLLGFGSIDRRVSNGNDKGGVEVTRTCARCGVTFEGALHGRYHSDACKKAAYRERKKHGNAQTSKELRTCARCGVQFSGVLHGRYHSDACKQKAYRERKARKAVTV